MEINGKANLNTKTIKSKLIDLIEFKRGQNITSEEMKQGEIPVISAGIEPSGFHNKHNVNGPTITVSSSGANAGIVLFHNYDIWAADCIYANKSRNIYFVFYLLKYYQPVITNLQRGSAQPHVYSKDIKRIKVSIPPEDIQDKISSLLKAYDQLIEINEKKIKLLKEKIDLFYRDFFINFYIDYINKNKNYKTNSDFKNFKKLDDFGVIIESGSRPKGGIDLNLKSGIPSLGAENITELGSFKFYETKYIDEVYFKKMIKGKNYNSSILIYKDGAYIGKTTYYDYNFPFDKYSINEHVFILKPLKMEYEKYLYLTLNQNLFYQTMQNLNRNAAQPGLSIKDILNLKVLIPEYNEILRFNNLIDPLFKILFNTAKKNKLLAKLRDILINKLISETQQN